MRNVVDLMERCRVLGAIFIHLNDRFKVQAPQPLPDDIIADLKEAKQFILQELRRQLRNESECWLLEEWRRTSIPEWRNILRQSIQAKDTKRQEYARWMLKEILLDPEYTEDDE